MHAILKLTVYRLGPFLVKVESRLHFRISISKESMISLALASSPCPHTSKLIRCVEPTKFDKKGKKQRRREKRHRRRLWMLHCCTMRRLRRDVREIDRRTDGGGIFSLFASRLYSAAASVCPRGRGRRRRRISIPPNKDENKET